MAKERKVYFRNCCMPQCASGRFSITHSFPRHQERLNNWYKALNLNPNLNYKNLLVCGRHFRPDDYVHKNSNFLTKNSVPSVNLKDLSELHLCNKIPSIAKRNRCLNTIDFPSASDFFLNNKSDNINRCPTRIEAQSEVKSGAAIITRRLTTDTPRVTMRKRPRISSITTMKTAINSLANNSNNPAIPTISLSTSATSASLTTTSTSLTTTSTTTTVTPTAKATSKVVLAHSLQIPLNQQQSPNAKQRRPLRSVAFAEPMQIESVAKSTESVTPSNDTTTTAQSKYNVVHLPNVLNDSKIAVNEGKVEVSHVDFEDVIQIDIFWLRAQCRCELCFDVNTNTSTFAIFDLPADLVPDTYVYLKNCTEIQINWSDGHQSNFPTVTLFQMCPRRQTPLLDVDYILWSKKQATMRDEFKPLHFTELIFNEDEINTALVRLQRFGVIIIDQIQTSGTQKPILCELIMRRLFSNLEPFLRKEKRTIFLQTQLLPHTNCTYESHDCGLQAISLSNDCTKSVELKIVDSFNVTNLLKRENRKTYDFLSTFKQTINYRNFGNCYSYKETPLIQLNDGYVERVHFTPYHLTSLPQQDFLEYKVALTEFALILQRDCLQWNMTISKDMLVIFDNWRICWQLQEKTQLDCIYVDRRDYLNHIQSLHVSTTGMDVGCGRVGRRMGRVG